MVMPRKIRAYVEIPVSPVEMGHLILYAMTVMNISLTGCFIKIDQALEMGTPIAFSLPLRDEKMLELRGTITRQQGTPHGYGISFDLIPDEERKELALLIAASEETPKLR
jgi:hypothetical protein